MLAEKRAMERFNLQLLASISLLGEEREQKAIELLTKNISAGGAFFETDLPLAVGTRLEIEVILPLRETKGVEGDKALMRVVGSIIRSDEKGMAICFDKDYQILPLGKGNSGGKHRSPH